MYFQFSTFINQLFFAQHRQIILRTLSVRESSTKEKFRFIKVSIYTAIYILSKNEIKNVMGELNDSIKKKS